MVSEQNRIIIAVVTSAVAGGVFGALSMHFAHAIRANKKLSNPNGLALILQAAEFAAIKHRSQTRKDPQRTPYINHPLGVARILIDEGGVSDPDVIVSALL